MPSTRLAALTLLPSALGKVVSIAITQDMVLKGVIAHHNYVALRDIMVAEPSSYAYRKSLVREILEASLSGSDEDAIS